MDIKIETKCTEAKEMNLLSKQEIINISGGSSRSGVQAQRANFWGRNSWHTPASNCRVAVGVGASLGIFGIVGGVAGALFANEVCNFRK